MENRLFQKQCVGGYLMMVTKVIQQDRNLAENLFVILLDYNLLKSILNEVLMNGKFYFLR
jgi:hypothetical protein